MRPRHVDFTLPVLRAVGHLEHLEVVAGGAATINLVAHLVVRVFAARRGFTALDDEVVGHERGERGVSGFVLVGPFVVDLCDDAVDVLGAELGEDVAGLLLGDRFGHRCDFGIGRIEPVEELGGLVFPHTPFPCRDYCVCITLTVTLTLKKRKFADN